MVQRWGSEGGIRTRMNRGWGYDDPSVGLIGGIPEDTLRQYMTQGIIVTQWAQGASVVSGHLMAVETGSGAEAVTVWVQPDGVGSSGLYSAINTQASPPATTIAVSPATAATIEELRVVAFDAANALSAGSRLNVDLTGDPPYWEAMAQSVNTYLTAQGVEFSSEVLEGVFGTYGSLRILYVELGEAYVLIDTVTGNIDGPYQPGNVMDGRPLLEANAPPYETGSGVGFVDSFGCQITTAKSWHCAPPTGPGTLTPFNPCPTCTIPPGWVPPPGGPKPPTWPAPPTPPAYPPAYNQNNPGWANWNCVLNPSSQQCACVEVSLCFNTRPGQVVRVIPKKLSCAGCPLTFGPCTGSGTGTPQPSTTCPCTSRGWYY